VTRLNRFVTDNSTANRFVTFFHAELDRSAGTLRYCNAGHNPPILCSGDGSTTVLEATGPVLGLLDVPYRQGERAFPEGSTLVAFSDGITETVDRGDEEYGDDRLVELVAAHATASPAALRDAILGDVERFASGVPQHDDVTLVIVRRVGE
jgi:sigma-B regulation protein RsbU (phosphoserine phosphatase)